MACAEPATAGKPSASIVPVPLPTNPPKSDDPLRDARYSLQLKSAPLAQTLGILGKVNDVRFRFAAIPDAVVSVAMNDAPLLPSLNNILYAAGFDLVRRERQMWIVNRQPSTPIIKPPARDRQTSARTAKSSVQNQNPISGATTKVWPTTWQIWTRSSPPGKGWMEPLALKSPVSSAQQRAMYQRSTMPVPFLPEPPLSLSGWQTLALDFAPSPLGVAVHANQSTLDSVLNRQSFSVASQASMAASSARKVWLRWPFWLRRLPVGAQLRLHTGGQATLWINGARILPRWSGSQLLEVDNLLQTGFNCLAVEWNPPAEPGSPAEPLLRYEWIFANS